MGETWGAEMTLCSSPQGNSERTQALFNCLMNDSNAELSQKQQALRFSEGMEAFNSLTKLIAMMVDECKRGYQCIKSIVGFVSLMEEVEELIVPILRYGMAGMMSKPFYTKLRNKYFNMIFCIPILVSFLNQVKVISKLRCQSVDIICSFLLIVAKALGEAQNSADVASLAMKLQACGDVDEAELLCMILLIVPEGPTDMPSTKRR